MKIIFDKDNFMIASTLRKTPKSDWVLFDKIKNKVVGVDYELSLTFIGKQRMRTLNKTHRQKDYNTDILSFPLDEEFSAEQKTKKQSNQHNQQYKMGEIFINLDKANSKAKDFDRTPQNYLLFVFIHGLFHLKGYDHGDEMEKQEMKIRKIFNI